MATYSPVEIGARYGRLLVISGPHVKRVGKVNQRKQYYTCKCDCGKEKSVQSAKLKTGHTVSCGCLRSERSRKQWETHGDTYTRLYNVWCGIKGRCLNPSSPAFANYGGRGITVCAEWKDNFTVFRDWANSHGYAKGLTIDRINNNGNYEPSNCRWISRAEQARNKRTNVFTTAWGETKCISGWAEDPRCIVEMRLLWARLGRGWEPERAMATPAKPLDQSWRNKKNA